MLLSEDEDAHYAVELNMISVADKDVLLAGVHGTLILGCAGLYYFVNCVHGLFNMCSSCNLLLLVAVILLLLAVVSASAASTDRCCDRKVSC